jgi:hypothetical protein
MANASSLDETKGRIRPCTEKSCTTTELETALKVVVEYMKAGARDVSILQPLGTQGLCKVAKEWATAGGDDAAVVWAYLLSREREWGEHMRREITAAAVFRVKVKTMRTVSADEAYRYVSDNIKTAGAEAKCGFWKTLFFGFIASGDIREAQQKAPQVGWEIAEVIVAGLRKKDPAAADAARAYLRVAILAR